MQHYLPIAFDPSLNIMDHPKLIYQNRRQNPLVHKGLNQFCISFPDDSSSNASTSQRVSFLFHMSYFLPKTLSFRITGMLPWYKNRPKFHVIVGFLIQISNKSRDI